jgi:hypothetical protein
MTVSQTFRFLEDYFLGIGGVDDDFSDFSHQQIKFSHRSSDIPMAQFNSESV